MVYRPLEQWSRGTMSKHKNRRQTRLFFILVRLFQRWYSFTPVKSSSTRQWSHQDSFGFGCPSQSSMFAFFQYQCMCLYHCRPSHPHTYKCIRSRYHPDMTVRIWSPSRHDVQCKTTSIHWGLSVIDWFLWEPLFSYISSAGGLTDWLTDWLRF
jgi:hypothetical protein